MTGIMCRVISVNSYFEIPWTPYRSVLFREECMSYICDFSLANSIVYSRSSRGKTGMHIPVDLRNSPRAQRNLRFVVTSTSATHTAKEAL